MRNKFLICNRRLRGGADPNDDISDDDAYDDKPIVVPKHKRGREMQSSIMSKKAVEAVRQMSLSTKHYDPLNTHSENASVVEEYHKGYSNDQMYLVPDSTLRTMKNIVNYQLKKPPTTYYVNAKNLDTLPQPTIFDNIKMSLDSVMLKIDALGDDDESTDLTTTSGSSTSDSLAIDVPEYDDKEVKEESKPSQQTEEQIKKLKPETVKSETETTEQILASKMPESPLSESSDSGEESSENEMVEINKEPDDEQVLKRALVPDSMIQQTTSVVDTDHLTAHTGHPETYPNFAQPNISHMIAETDHAKVDTDFAKADTDHVKADTDHVKADTDHMKSVTDHSKQRHQKQYFILEGKFDRNMNPVFAIKKCTLTNETLPNTVAYGVNHKKLIFTKKHSKKVYVDIEGQFVQKELPKKDDERTYDNKIDDTDNLNDCEFTINVQRPCPDNSEIRINISGHLVRQENSVRYVPVLIVKLRNKRGKVNNEPQLQLKQDTADISVNNQTKPQPYEQSENVNSQLNQRDEVTQGPSINYQSKPRLTNEGGTNINERPEMFQYGSLLNYQSMPIIINGPGTSINKQEIHPRKEIGQGIINNQIVPVLTGDHNTKQRERVTYRAVNTQVMPVFKMPMFQMPVTECMYLPQNQYYSIIPTQQPIDNVSPYLNPQLTDAAHTRIMTPNAFNTLVQNNDIMAPDQDQYLSRAQNLSIEANTLLFTSTESPTGRNIEHTGAEKETVVSKNDESADKNTPVKKMRKSKQIKTTASFDKTRPMDTGGAGNKINIVNNPIVGQLEEFFIGHVHIPQTHLLRDTFEPTYLRPKKFSLDDIFKIKNTAGYLLRLNLQQLSESYSGETTLFEKAILKSQIDIEHFFMTTDNVESLILLPEIIKMFKIHYTEMHLKTYYEESYVKITLQHSIIAVFCNGSLWFIALENTNNGRFRRKKVILPHYFRNGGIDKCATRLRCVTQKDMSRRKYSDNDLRKLIEKLANCSPAGANTAEMHNNTNFISITTSSSQLSNTGLMENEIFKIYWDVISFLK